jgi:hypothetical protein
LLKNLEKLVKPPEKPIDAPKNLSDWEKFDAEFPDDYKAIVSMYGMGAFGRFLWLKNPFTEIKHLNFFVYKEKILTMLKELRADLEDYNYPIYPEPEGLLPFATTDYADILFWITKGQPSNWTIAILEARSDLLELHDTNTLGLIIGLQRQAIKSKIFGSDIFDHKAPFYQHSSDYLSYG